MKKQSILLIVWLGILSVLMTSCGDDEDPVVVDPPFASFISEVDDSNTLKVTFTSNSLDADAYEWSFGDGKGTSTEENPTYTYEASGTYTVTLKVTNAGGEDQESGSVTVLGFGENLIQNGDMSSSEGWTSSQLWTAEDNKVDHDFVNGVFLYKNGSDADGNPYQWSNHVLYTEVPIEAGSQYKFNADVSSESGTLATWFEVFLVKSAPVDESNIGGDAVQAAIKSFGDGENCSATPFEGGFIEIAKLCPAVNPFSKNINEEGLFTLNASDISDSGTVFLVFKAGSGFAPDGETAGFRDGLTLDNVSIQKVL